MCVSEVELPANTVKELVSQAATPQSLIIVNGVQANPTETGVEIILQTTVGEQLQITNRSAENNFIADIPNAQLLLPNGDTFTFSSQNPVEGITQISVINLDANNIRVTITGVTSLPVVELFDSPEGLIFSLTSAVAATPSPQPQAEAEPESEIPPAQPSTQSDQPIELVVTGEQNGYRVPNASTATKTDTPLRDIPQSIQVIPRQLLEDQNTTRIQDALENVSGINKRGNFGGTDAGAYFIRGFSQSGNFRNGFRDSFFGTPVDIANIERIEVLKGPASVLYGQLEPGGIINVVTKQPLSTPYYAADFNVGNYAFYRSSVDLSGPLTADDSLLYRLNLAYQNAGSFRDFNFTERLLIAPVITWNISDRTSLTFDFEYLDNKFRFDRGLSSTGDRPTPIPISRFLGYPFDGDGTTVSAVRAGYRFEHKFSEDWQFRNALSISSALETSRSAFGQAPLLEDRFRRINVSNSEFVSENYTLQTELTGKLNTGAIGHQLLFGLELWRFTETFASDGGQPAPPLDVFNPNYNVPLPQVSDPEFLFTARASALGIYVQDQITLTDNLKVLIGGRFDTTRFESDGDDRSNNAFSPRAGIVYQPIEPISLYASYSQSFNPVTFGRSRTDTPFEPERGTQYEIGIKADITERLSATLAAFQITKSNVLTPDPEDSDFSVQVGEQRSRGIELDVTGEILPGWRIITSYAYTDAITSRDNDIPTGNRIFNVPQHAASLWTTYEVQQGSLQGLGLGLGLYYVGDRFADNQNTSTMVNYFRTDSAIYYKRDNWRLGLNIRNLFNTTYYETSQSRQIIYPGAPFTVIGSFSIQF
ncbi:TonB-dependent siderophore receptor [Anabaena subtropica]|uniref:TonB-dependent siderophore receptor n=1 Tax=Anabaena subtropica FACHB-260 TaxID=2692884 RepID=A0ABR8CHF7_9NOST|nr:TonB-dependent siderophore receptor [Anabaena subtropica]MBD2342621.1 TonB-dependent siderophore receptor [Anabaena subtropica FACHB-260]